MFAKKNYSSEYWNFEIPYPYFWVFSGGWVQYPIFGTICMLQMNNNKDALLKDSHKSWQFCWNLDIHEETIKKQHKEKCIWYLHRIWKALTIKTHEMNIALCIKWEWLPIDHSGCNSNYKICTHSFIKRQTLVTQQFWLSNNTWEKSNTNLRNLEYDYPPKLTLPIQTYGKETIPYFNYLLLLYTCFNWLRNGCKKM